MTIWKYVKVGGAWRYKAAVEIDGKLMPNMVRVDGKPEVHAEGSYYMRLNKQWIRLDSMPNSVLETQERLLALDLARTHGLVPPEAPKITGSLRDAIEPYLAGYGVGKAKKTVNGMRRTLEAFVAVVGNKRLSAMTESDVMRYWQHVVDNSRTSSWRTASNEC